ncbi:multiple sugar transport system permease protein [Motilibacter peucedani]|uniref:Multiple sugar transport system permease protein n=1 Tax=Motilibacter peucedani TaxID=598650 RepID=A0A420XU21_9ACTN|nr:sugar ABC transporter permease [Motilibacter peucedani]RKS80324.1 multiple sugar transport system permease protein [Motilibacter peucedani]
MSTVDATTAVGPTATTAPPRRRRRGNKGATRAFWLFAGPFLLGLVVFVYLPIIWSAVLSFTSAQNTVTSTNFIGFDNYVDLLKPGPFRSSLWTFTIFAAIIVPLTFALALLLAVLLNQVTIARAFFRSAFFLPTACSYVVASMVWKLSIFNGVRFGLANQVIGAFGFDNIAWLSSISPPWYWLVLATVRLWLQLGFYIILFLAGLQRISPELYEAAYVDGAKPGWQTFRFITVPQLRTTSVSVLLLLLIAAYQAFDEFYNLLGNSSLARPPLVYLYYTAQGNQDYGHGSAGAMILAILIIIVTLVQGRIFGFGRAEK